MNRYIFTVSKPTIYHCRVDAKNVEEAKEEIERQINRRSIIAFCTNEGQSTYDIDSVESLESKKYKCRISRTLSKEIIVDANCEEDAIDFAIDELNDTLDEDLDVEDYDAEILEIIYDKDGKES